ncbi:methylglyoxal synthase [Persicobacter psychrovividus]|uniref:Methylglyoxal synthase n=1 Tax=Persicobacter psychrovividus TaxID=387638 RepID=A0ABM7V9X2_9BACT|nr:methylglyoxal synthase [Persicobacter psychrovividus]
MATLGKYKNIALVAHDNRKKAMMDWAKKHKEKLGKHNIFATGTTGKLLEETLDIKVNRFFSGPLGGDQQIGAKIAEGEIDFLIFFWDPLEQQPHDPDIKALLRIAVVYNIPVASNIASADFLLSSPYFESEYAADAVDFDEYLNRTIE